MNEILKKQMKAVSFHTDDFRNFRIVNLYDKELEKKILCIAK